MKALTATMGRLGMSESAARTALRVMGILTFTVLTALAAQIQVPVPGTVVPITLQTAIVLLAGLKLGSRDGAISQALYVAGGAVGMPFFAAASVATAGYLVGFVLAALVAGALPRKTLVTAWITAFFASLVIFIPGVIQLKWFMSYTWEQAFMLGVVPFLVGDVVKVTLAATTYRLLPNKQR